MLTMVLEVLIVVVISILVVIAMLVAKLMHLLRACTILLGWIGIATHRHYLVSDCFRDHRME